MRSVLPRGLGRTPVQLLLSSYKLCQPLLFRCTVDGLRRSWGGRKKNQKNLNILNMWDLSFTALTCCWGVTMTDVHFVSKSQSRSSHLQHRKLPRGFSEECHQTQPGKVGEKSPRGFQSSFSYSTWFIQKQHVSRWLKWLTNMVSLNVEVKHCIC